MATDFEDPKPQTPAEILRGQQAALELVIQTLERLVMVATNKNAEVSTAVEAAREAVNEQIVSLRQTQAEADRAKQGFSAAKTAYSAAKDDFSTIGMQVDGAVNELHGAKKELKGAVNALGSVRDRRSQNIMVFAVFLAALVLPWALTLVPGLGNIAATLALHEWPTRHGQVVAGAGLINDADPGVGTPIINYLKKNSY